MSKAGLGSSDNCAFCGELDACKIRRLLQIRVTGYDIPIDKTHAVASSKILNEDKPINSLCELFGKELS